MGNGVVRQIDLVSFLTRIPDPCRDTMTNKTQSQSGRA